MLKTIFKFGINDINESIVMFGASGRPFKVNPNAVLDTTGLQPEGVCRKTESIIQESEIRGEKNWYLQRESSALGDLLMLIPVVRYLRTLGYNIYVRTWEKFLDFYKLFGIYGEPWQAETKKLGLLTDGIVERDHWDQRLKNLSRIEILFKALGLQNIPTKIDWSYNPMVLPDVRFASKWVVFQAVGASPQRSLTPEIAQKLLGMMNKDAINVVVVGEEKIHQENAKNLLRFRQDSILELFAWVAKAACLVTTDSAPLWIDHFTQTPAIILFGTSRPKERLSLHPKPEVIVPIELYKEVGCEDSCLENPKICNLRYDCMKKLPAEQIYEMIRPDLLKFWNAKRDKVLKVEVSELPREISDRFMHGPRLGMHMSGQTWYDDFQNPIRVKPGEEIPSWVLNKYKIDPSWIHPDSLRLEGAFEFALNRKGKFTVAITRDMNGRGDVLMASVIAKALKERYKEAVTVWYAVKPGYERLLQGNPYVDKVYTSELQMHNDSPDIKMNVNDLEFKAEVKSFESEGRVIKNRASIYLESLGLSLINKTPFYRVTQKERDWAEKELVKLEYDLSKPIIGLQYWGSNITRTYPHMADVEIKLKARGYQTFCLDGQEFGGRWHYDLGQISAIVERMAIIVTSNSFFYHLAGALLKRAVAIFGSEDGRIWTEDYEKVFPLQIDCPMKKQKCWWSLQCLPGVTLRQKEQTHTPECLVQIKPEVVVAKIEESLTKPKKILVVILTWNLLELTKKAIDSIRSYHNYDFFVVDNDSADGTKEWLRNQGIKFVSLKCTVPAAWNIGIKKAYEEKYDYVLICNNDIVLSPEYIDVIVETAERRKAFAVTGKVYNRNESTIDKFQDQVQNVEVQTLTIESGDFSALLLSRNCMERVGAFDVRFGPRYQSDEDYFLRMKLVGGEFIRTYRTTFYHLSGAVIITDPIETSKNDKEWAENVKKFKEKWCTDPYVERNAVSNIAEMKKRNINWNDKIWMPIVME